MRKKTDGDETGPLAMDGEEEEATQLMTDKEEGDPLSPAAVEGPQSFTYNVEESSKTELRSLKDKQSYCRDRYSASQLSESVLRMETSLPDKIPLVLYVNMLLVLRVPLHTKLVGAQKNSFLKTKFS